MSPSTRAHRARASAWPRATAASRSWSRTTARAARASTATVCAGWPTAPARSMEVAPPAAQAGSMPIATPEQYAAMLNEAAAGGHALAAINVTSSETLNGVMRGFAEAGADGIVQVTTGGAEFASGGAVGDMALGARALAEYARVLADRYPVAIALHTDHAPPERFDAFVRPLIDESRARVTAGDPPLFNSHMFDGSTLPLDDNLAISSRLLDELA